MSDKFKQVPLNLALISSPSNGKDAIETAIEDTPFHLLEVNLGSNIPEGVDIIVLCDLGSIPPLYHTAYLKHKYPNKAVLVIGPTYDDSLILMHVVAGAQDYFNCERLKDSPGGIVRCIRFAYERERRNGQV